MKTLFSLILLLSVTSVSACVDFTGLYNILGSFPKMHLKVTQDKCSSIEFTYIDVESGDENTIKLATDGRLQPSMAESEYIYLIHRENELEWNIINLETDEVSQGRDHLNANGDILTEIVFTNSDGNSTTQFAAFRRLKN